jgi:hypothetical protein
METAEQFFIKMQDGIPEGHPFFLSNLLQCGIEPRGQPNWAEFLPQPHDIPVGKYQVLEQQYVVEEDKVLGKWFARDMTEEERAELPPEPLPQITQAEMAQMTGSAPDVIE